VPRLKNEASRQGASWTVASKIQNRRTLLGWIWLAPPRLPEPIATLMAVVAAVTAPYLAAGIEKRRKRRAALRLAELTVQGIGLLATLHGAASGNPLPDADRAARSINMPVLLARIAAMPSSDIDDADALEAFIRINGLAAAAARSSDAIIKSRQLSVDAAAHVLREFPELRSEAEAQLVKLKRRLT